MLVWQDNTAVNYSNWGPPGLGPSMLSHNSCYWIQSSSGLWRPGACTNVTMGVVCKLPRGKLGSQKAHAQSTAGLTAGHTVGSTARLTAGHIARHTVGSTAGCTVGHTVGPTAGHTVGSTAGLTAGRTAQGGGTAGPKVTWYTGTPALGGRPSSMLVCIQQTQGLNFPKCTASPEASNLHHSIVVRVKR